MLVVETDDICGIGVLDTGCTLVPLPRDVRVETVDGEPIKPTCQFWVTLDTFDPFHALTDQEDP